MMTLCPYGQTKFRSRSTTHFIYSFLYKRGENDKYILIIVNGMNISLVKGINILIFGR